MAEPDFAERHGYTIDTPNLPTVVGHTEEARAMVAAGDLQPGDKALDVPVASMSDRELAEETVILLRNQRDAVNGLIAGFNASPLGAMLNGGKMSGPLAYLFGMPPGA